MTAPLILDLGLVLLIASAGGWLARRVGLPAVVGYLAVGLLVSPFTPGYVADRAQIQLLADVGVALLLFEVGIEVDLAKLRAEHRALLAVAPLQVAVSVAIVTLVLSAAGVSPIGAALLGLGVASSSSVVVVNITRSRRRTTDPPTERAMLGWSVVQDVSVVAGAVVLLALAGVDERSASGALGGFAVFLVVAAASARLLPRALHALRSEHDLFLIVSVASGLVLAALGERAFGLPLALAAFIAGLAISEGPAMSEARQRLLPFRDVFAVLFFVAVGSVIDPEAVPGALGALALLIALVGAKVAVTYALARIASLPRPRQLAVGLGQVGEFSFVLVSAAASAGVIDKSWFVATLGAVVVTIAGSAVVARRAGPKPLNATSEQAVAADMASLHVDDESSRT